MVFISHMEAHSVINASKNYKRYEIKISPDILNSPSKNIRLYSVLLNRPIGFDRVINLPDNETAQILSKIKSEYKSDSPYKEEMLSNYLDILFITIYRKYPTLFSIAEGSTFEIVKKIQQGFEADISKSYTISELADLYHINKFYLSHIFKSVTGYSIMDYLKNLRISRAETLLTETKLSISEIVYTCGFSDNSNFSREFKSITGLSPRDFRKKHTV